MGLRFVNKRINLRAKAHVIPAIENIVETTIPKEEKPKNKKEKKEPIMTNMEQIAAAEAVMTNLEPEVKVVKKDRGLIERTESSKIILTEDNRQVLND